MPLGENKFLITGKYIVKHGENDIKDLLLSYGFVGGGVRDLVVPQHKPTERQIVLGRFPNNVLPAHIDIALEQAVFVRPTLEEALEFGLQYRGVLSDLEREYLRDSKNYSTFLIFPNELPRNAAGRVEYKFIIMRYMGGDLEVHLDYAVPWKREITFAFAANAD